MKRGPCSLRAAILGAILALVVGSNAPLWAELFAPISNRYRVGDPDAGNPLDITEGPKHLAAGDLDGDGIADVVTANLDGSVSVLLSRGDGTMEEQLLVPARGLLTGSSLRAVELADFNRDGFLDAAVADIARGGVVMLLGSGNGTLTPFTRIEIGAARALASADLDGDGILDLVAASSPPDCEHIDECFDETGPNYAPWCVPSEWPPPALAVLPGRGDGAFGAPLRLLENYDGCLYDVACADVDRDGKQDVLALDFTHHTLFLFGGNGNGSFQPGVRVAIPGEGPRAFTLAFLDERLTGGEPPPAATLDIVVANRDSPSLSIFLGRGGFAFSEPRSIHTLFLPRDVAAADLDGDGWAELVTTARNSNSLQVYRALGDAWFEPERLAVPTGTSPRHVVLADFTGDGALDAAVNNRISGDVSVFSGRSGLAGFLISKHFYHAGLAPVDVVVGDFDGDELPDVATVSLRSHDLRVRRNLGGGDLGGETVYDMNYEPSAVASGDLNGDGRLDLVVTTLGTENGPVQEGSGSAQGGSSPATSGTLLLLPGRGDGSFSDPAVVRNEEISYRPVSLRLGDLSGDGVLDIAAGGMQGELVLYRGRGDGSVDAGVRLPTAATGLALNLTLGDFNGDERLDIATSQAKLLLNHGDGDDGGGGFFSGSWSGPIHNFAAGVPNIDKTWFVDSGDLNGDGALDLMLALTFVRPDPIAVFHGRGDGTFQTPAIYDGPDMGVVASVAEDMDGDGTQDIVIGNRCAASVMILRGLQDGRFERSETVAAYAVEGLAVADMNRDGRPDLVGVGFGLWVLLNGGVGALVEPTAPEGPRPLPPGLYLNELMAFNRSFSAGRNGETLDWIEIFNSGAGVQALAGWALRHRTREGDEREWRFPPGSVLGGGQHLVVFCGSDAGIPLGLPGLLCLAFGLYRGGGESLALIDPAGNAVDRVLFPAMPADVSYARDLDASRYFGYNPRPTPGVSNSRPINLEPRLSAENPFTLHGDRVGVTASVFDDVGVAYASVTFQLQGEAATTELPLQDDGGHGDGLAGDGLFGAVLPQFPAGSTVLYSLRVVDLEGGTVEVPSPRSGDFLRVVVPPSGIRLQLSEVVADNLSGLRDEAGETEDWLELENCGESVVSLDGLGLTKEYFDQDPAWRFPAGVRLAPRERLVAFCDGNPTQGGLHTSFRLDRDGDQVLLVTTAQPAAVLDALSFGPLPGDAAFGRLDCGGDPQVLDRPTPGTANVGPVLFRRGDGNSDGEINLTDAVLTLNYLFLGGEAPACQDAADANDSSNLDLTDAVRLLNFLFLGGQAPAAPFPECGLDRSPDGLAPCEYPPASCAAAG